MAVVLKGEQQTDGSFVFAASSEQVNSLNKMCDGNLNTQLSDVQFGMKMKAESLNLSNITAKFTFPYIERIRGFNLPTETITLPDMSTNTLTITNKSYNSLSELFNEVCAYFTYDLENTMNLGDGKAYFRQELVYDEELLNNYILSLTYNFKCIRTTSAKYSPDNVNLMETRIYSYGSSKMSSTSSIESEQLMKILKMDDIISAYQPLIKSGSL